MKNSSRLPQNQRLSSFDKILQFYQTKYAHNPLLQRQAHSTKPIIYNNAINVYTPRHSIKTKRKQTIRTIYLNNRQRKKQDDSKFVNFSQIKDKMKEKIDYFSVKNQYDHLLNIVSDQDLIDKLKFQLNSLPKPMRGHIQHRRDSQKFSNQGYSDIMSIQGNRFQKTHKNQRFTVNKSSLPQLDTRTKKYRKSQGELYIGRIKNNSKLNQQQDHLPLTGWN